jgi:predicted glutamine amidotransferase
MCIIAAVPTGGRLISFTEMNACARSNDDGGGVMTINEEGKLLIYKDLNMRRFHYMVREYQETHGHQSPVVAHWRLGTHGGVNLDNTHPFLVHDDVAFCHNGVITNVPNKEGMSDSRVFNEMILQNIPREVLFTPAIKELIKEYITGDKLAFLTKDREVHIVNFEVGTVEEGIWYSNLGYYTQKVTNMDFSSKEAILEQEEEPREIVYDYRWSHLPQDNEDQCYFCLDNTKELHDIIFEGDDATYKVCEDCMNHYTEPTNEENDGDVH